MADINVTPLVDVMLVLLIIFMVTAPLLTAGVPVNLPDSRAKPLDHPDKPVDIALDASGKLFIDKDPVSPDALPDRLEALATRAPLGLPPPVMLRADHALPYEQVARVLGELNRAGLNRVSLVTNVGGR